MPETKRYARLKSLLQEKIVSGNYAPGDRFFSQNEMMKKYGLSLSTVSRALDELVREGYLVRQHGKGTFVARVEAGTAPITRTETRHVALFAIWSAGLQTANSSRVDMPAVYSEIERMLPPWVSIRLNPLSGKPDELEPFLFSRDPIDVSMFFYPAPGHMEVLEKMAQFAPVVLIDSESPNTHAAMSAVLTDPASATRTAIAHLLQSGHKSIAMIVNGSDTRYVSACIRGYRDALRESEIPYRETLTGQTTPADANGYHELLTLVDRNADLKITAVVAVGTGVGLGASYALQTMAHTASAPVSLVVVDDPSFSAIGNSTAAQVVFPASEIALACSSSIKDALQGRTQESRIIRPVYLAAEDGTINR